VETTPTSALHKFIVYAPDKTEAGTFEKRLSVRSQHLENASVLIGTGTIKVAGAMLTPESIDARDKKMIGSMFIMQAGHIDAVRDIIQNDIYYTAGVWDPEKLVIVPFISATPFP